ncbi:hypothetical protein F4679DRAFT_574299 [Xylaria curta]|nr:hypothetical protein F4679DRAFT_574299 [Xylaria curta]
MLNRSLRTRLTLSSHAWYGTVSGCTGRCGKGRRCATSGSVPPSPLPPPFRAKSPTHIETFYCIKVLQTLLRYCYQFSHLPRYFQRKLFSRHNITVTKINTDLGPRLSSGSLIFGSDIPLFESLVRNHGYRITTTLLAFSGIEIYVDQLESINIQPDDGSAILQAGTHNGRLMKTLWDEGYVTITGATRCVELISPALGGDHGRLDGLHGLVMDNIIHYNVVLADGTEIGVNETSHPDLLWVLKGAGHSFAVVTSVVKKIYPKTKDKLETVFEALNIFRKGDNGTTPPKMGFNYGSIIMDTSVSTIELLAPFNAIGAFAEDMFDASYSEVSDITAGDYAPGLLAISSAMTLGYNVPHKRSQYPELATTAYLWHEGYATAGYQTVPFDSTAYPHREENHINAGQPNRQPRTYVNYAMGHDYES